MIDAHYNKCVIGNDYLAFLEAIKDLAEGRKTLVINDNKLLTSDIRSNTISSLEFSLLEKLGVRYAIPTLINIRNFTKISTRILKFNNSILKLDASPFQNFQELLRKLKLQEFNHLFESLNQFSEEEFNRSYRDYIEGRVYKHLNISWEKQSSRHEMVSKLEKVFEEFSLCLSKTDFAKEFIFFIELQFQKSYSGKFSNKKDLLINFLGPEYLMDMNTVRDHLLELVEYRGGNYISTNILTPLNRVEELKEILLPGPQGLVSADCFESFNLKNQQAHNQASFQAIWFEFKSSKLQSLNSGTKVSILKPNRVGSDYPFWQFYIGHDNDIRGHYLYECKLGDKPIFHYEKALADLAESLRTFFPALELVDIEEVISFKPRAELWTYQTTNNLGHIGNSLQLCSIFTGGRP